MGNMLAAGLRDAGSPPGVILFFLLNFSFKLVLLPKYFLKKFFVGQLGLVGLGFRIGFRIRVTVAV